MKCGSWLFPKITSANLCKPIHDIINYSTFICSFEYWKCGKDEKKLRKYRENKKSFFTEIKSIFNSFWRTLTWWINKNSGHKFKILAFFYKHCFIPTQPQCCLIFSWIELPLLLRCCLIHISIIILRLLILSVFLSISRPRSAYDLHFIMINRIISWVQTHLFFCLFFWTCPLSLDDNVYQECK